MIYRNMDFDEYRRIDAVNNSVLVKYNQRPDMLTVPDTDTEALKFGRAFHTYILEPEKLSSNIIIIPEDIKVRRGAKWEAFKAVHAGKELMHQSEYDKKFEVMDAMRDSLYSGKYETAKNIIEQATDRELTVTWNDIKTDVMCKARIDIACPALNYIADIKTCTDADHAAWIKKELYAGRAPHFQPAWYLRGCHQHESFRNVNIFFWILFEKNPPYGISVVKACPADIGQNDMVDIANKQIDMLLPRYIDDVSRNMFVGILDTIKSGTLPDWYVNTVMDEFTI